MRSSLIADRIALLMVTPTSDVDSLVVEVRVKGALKGIVDLAHPNRLPDSDQAYDSRGTLAYSLRAWWAELPADWVQPGLTLDIADGSGRQGEFDTIDLAALTELVINDIRLGMLTEAPRT